MEGMTTPFQPIYKHELSPSGQDKSQPLSPSQFQDFAAKGGALLDSMAARRSRTVLGQQGGVYSSPQGQREWAGIKSDAYQATRGDWGGATINPRTGRAVDFHEPDKHAVTVRAPGQETISAAHSLSEEQFGQHMDKARHTYRKQLRNAGHYLGVFHDSDKGAVEMDPVVVTGDPNGHREDVGRVRAQQVAAAAHATGGAYQFSSGNGFWPPHVKDG